MRGFSAEGAGSELGQIETSIYRKDFSVYIRDLLDRTTLARPAMFRTNDTSVSPLAKLFDELIFGVNDERRVECGERLPGHYRGTIKKAFGTMNRGGRAYSHQGYQRVTQHVICDCHGGNYRRANTLTAQ